MGLIKEDGSKACRDTINSGLTKGKTKPRHCPKTNAAGDDDADLDVSNAGDDGAGGGDVGGSSGGGAAAAAPPLPMMLA